MLEMLMNQNVLVYVMLVAGVAGIVTRIILSTYMGTLMKAAESMGTTRKKQLKKIRERFEDLGAIGYRMRNVDVFVERAVGKLKIGRWYIHSVEGFIKNMLIISGGAGIFGAGIEYYRTGEIKAGVATLLWGTAVCGAELIAGNLWDISWRRYRLHTAMNDYFSNSLTERLEKKLQKEQEQVEVPVERSRKKKSEREETKPPEPELSDELLEQLISSVIG